MKPGGWLELSDFEMEHFSDDDTLHLAPSLGEFFRLLIDASTKFNRPMNVAAEHQKQMIDAGFTDVKEKIYKVGLTSCSTLIYISFAIWYPFGLSDINLAYIVPNGSLGQRKATERSRSVSSRGHDYESRVICSCALH